MKCKKLSIYSKIWIFFAGNWAKVQLPEFYPGRNHGSPYNKMENLAPTLRILGNLGGSFGMGRPQMGKGNT